MSAILKCEVEVTETEDEDSNKSGRKGKRMIETRELIQMVHQKKCLWDRTDSDYKDKTIKDIAWKEIYRQIEPSFDSLNKALRYEIGLQITKKWYNVRDSYVKSKKNGRSSRPYLYSDALTFLDPIYFVNNNRNFTFNEDRMSNDESGGAEGTETWLNEVFVDVDEGMTEVPNKRPKLEYANKLREDLDDNETNIVNILATLIQKEEDDDRSFFKSITPAVKMLNPEAKLEFRIQVMKLLKKLKNKNSSSTKSEIADCDSD